MSNDAIRQSHKFHDRMSSAIHEIAAQLVSYAKRRRFASIQYDDAEKSYLEQFPWFRLSALIAEKADAEGIGFEHASGQAPKEKAEPLAEE